MCPATLENALFFFDSYVAATMIDGKRLAIADFQVSWALWLWRLPMTPSWVLFSDPLPPNQLQSTECQLVGMVSLLIASKMYGFGVQLRVVRGSLLFCIIWSTHPKLT
jgi:hypothetical protein